MAIAYHEDSPSVPFMGMEGMEGAVVHARSSSDLHCTTSSATSEMSFFLPKTLMLVTAAAFRINSKCAALEGEVGYCGLKYNLSPRVPLHVLLCVRPFTSRSIFSVSISFSPNSLTLTLRPTDNVHGQTTPCGETVSSTLVTKLISFSSTIKQLFSRVGVHDPLPVTNLLISSLTMLGPHCCTAKKAGTSSSSGETSRLDVSSSPDLRLSKK